MISQVTQSNSSFHGVPNLKLNSSKIQLAPDNPLSLSQKLNPEKNQLIIQKSLTPGMRPNSRQSTGNQFFTPKEGRKLSYTPQGQSKSNLVDGQQCNAFTDYYNQHLVQENKLPSINKSNSYKVNTKQLLDESGSGSGSGSGRKGQRQKTFTFSSEVSNFEQNSNASTIDHQESRGKKSSFFKLKQQPLLGVLGREPHQNNSTFASFQNENNVYSEIQNLDGIMSPQHSLLINNQIEQKKNLIKGEESTSPFKSKLLSKKSQGKIVMSSLNIPDNVFQSQQQIILQEKIGGEKVLKQFINELLFAMKKNQFFDIFLEEYYQSLEKVQEIMKNFFLEVFTNNLNAIHNSLQSFLGIFYSLNDSNIFELKSFIFEFLVAKQGCNNTFIDKYLAFQLVEWLELYRPYLTCNEEQISLYESSQSDLRNSIIENCVTIDFFKKFDIDKVNCLSKTIIDLLFNKISSTTFFSFFYSAFNTNLQQTHINLIKDVLKKSLSDRREYNSVFRKNISYQLKKVQWLMPNQPQGPNYIEIIDQIPDIQSLMSKIAPQILEAPHTDHSLFAKFIKLFYSKYNVFNMVDIFLIFDIKQTESSKIKVTLLSSLLRQTLLSSKVASEIAKKIETFTLSIFD